MKLSVLWRGLPGHPIHPPLTDVTIGAYTLATAMALLSRLGVSEENTATFWWIALVAGLVVTLPTALTGVVEWLEIPRGTPLFRTATAHLAAMLSATILFAITAGAGHASYVDGELSGGALVLTLIGYAVLALGGWLGGSIVYVHGMRVLNLVDEPTRRAAAPVATPEKEEAEGG
jgi:uncharacterized membrane protein